MSIERELAEQKFVEAAQWGSLLSIITTRYRAWVLLWFSRRLIRRKLALRGVTNGELRYLERQIDEAHDRALMKYDEAMTSVQCITASEIAGRIYDEEDSGREQHRLQSREQGYDDEMD